MAAANYPTRSTYGNGGPKASSSTANPVVETGENSDVVRDYEISLSELTCNSKPHINVLTLLADESRSHADAIVRVIETRIMQVDGKQKLPILYLIDSIMKNCPDSPYREKFAKDIVHVFVHVFSKADEPMRTSLFRLRNTWNNIFPISKLCAIDMKVHGIDPAWPLTDPMRTCSASSNIVVPPAPTPVVVPITTVTPTKVSPTTSERQATSIHVNPRFLNQQASTSNTVAVTKPSVEDTRKRFVQLPPKEKVSMVTLQKPYFSQVPKSPIIRAPCQSLINAANRFSKKPEINQPYQNVRQPPAKELPKMSKITASDNNVKRDVVMSSADSDKNSDVNKKVNTKKINTTKNLSASCSVLLNTPLPRSDSDKSAASKKRHHPEVPARKTAADAQKPKQPDHHKLQKLTIKTAVQASPSASSSKFVTPKSVATPSKPSPKIVSHNIEEEDDEDEVVAIEDIPAKSRATEFKSQAPPGSDIPSKGRPTELKTQSPGTNSQTVGKLQQPQQPSKLAPKVQTSKSAEITPPKDEDYRTFPKAPQKRPTPFDDNSNARGGAGSFRGQRGSGIKPFPRQSPLKADVDERVAQKDVDLRYPHSQPTTSTRSQQQLADDSLPFKKRRRGLDDAPSTSRTPLVNVLSSDSGYEQQLSKIPPLMPELANRVEDSQGRKVPASQLQLTKPPSQSSLINGMPELPSNDRIFVDGTEYPVGYIDHIPVIVKQGNVHKLHFAGLGRHVTIDDANYFLKFNETREVLIDGDRHKIRFGGPSRELYMNDFAFRGSFGGPPIYATINGVKHKIILEGPAPEVKIDMESSNELKNRPVDFGGIQNKTPNIVRYNLPPQQDFTQPRQPMISFPLAMPNPAVPAPPITTTATFFAIAPSGQQQPRPFIPLAPSGVVLPAHGGQFFMPGILPVLPTGIPGAQVAPAMQPVIVPPPQPAPPKPVNVADLLNKLVSTGIIAPKQEPAPTAEQAKPEQKPVDRMSRSIFEIDTTIPTLKEPTAAIMTFEMKGLRVRYSSVVDALYKNTGLVCQHCSLRFVSTDQQKYSKHLDWHFKLNLQDKRTHDLSRMWYLADEDWVNYEEFGDDKTPKTKSDVFEKLKQKKEEPRTGKFFPASTNSVITAANEEHNNCSVCGEKFEQFWDEDEEAWKLRNAMLINDRAYHPLCHQDILNTTDTADISPNESTSAKCEVDSDEVTIIK